MEKVEATSSQYEVADPEIQKISQPGAMAMGSVRISESRDIILVPGPSADPRDPLNMPIWRKYLFIILLSVFSSLGLSLIGGYGGLLGFYIPQYAAAGATYADITALMTYPSMFMGIGNLIGIPIAVSVGRRPVFLVANVTVILGAVLAAYAENYNWQLAARMIIGLAAGQSEALVPMMIQEIHFIHERSTCLMWQCAGQTIVSAIYQLFASPIANKIGPGNWYNLGAGLAAVVFILSIFFVPESKYDRSLVAYGQNTDEIVDEKVDDIAHAAEPVPISQRPALDFVKYQPRTLWSDMRVFVNKPDWVEGAYTIKNTIQILLFPNVFWAFCINGLTIGVNIAMGTTYSAIITAPPYNWPDRSASYVTAGQIVTALIAMPFLGQLNDYVIKWRARKNEGVHEPEARLILLWIPISVGVMAATLYGQAGSYPERYHWFIIPFTYAAYYFCFLGANIAGITYLLDSYPARSGPVLIIICALRGFVSFGTSYGVSEFIARSGYKGAFGCYGGLTGLFGLLGLLVFVFGKRIRQYTGRWSAKDKTGKPSMSH